MNPEWLRTDDRAVSPVLGVVLMIVIAVVLAAVVGSAVLGLGSGPAEAPQASLEFSNDNGTVTATHTGGDPVEFSNVQVKVDGSGSTANPTGTLEAGDSTTVANNVAAGDTIRIIWQDPNSEKTTVIAEFEA